MNLNKFKNIIEDSCKKCFTNLKIKYSKESLCGYALYSDTGAMSISPALNSKKHLDEMCADDPEDAPYYRWSPGEWAYEFEGAEFFHSASKFLNYEINKLNSEEEFIQFRASVYDTCVQALESLIKNEFFDQNEECVIVFTVSDAEEPDNEIPWIKRLNNKILSCEFESWVKSL